MRTARRSGRDVIAREQSDRSNPRSYEPVLTSGELLTSRELQLAQLAAEGMTNKAIAERLGLSRFTVPNHLERIFAKMGVQRRGELIRKLHPQIAQIHAD